jgi:DNA-binding transcriptional MerR regulator
MSTSYNISEVSQRCGIPKDLLRQWERRYGSPNPSRNTNGDRVYSSQQLEKLLLIRQLVDQGKRPGKLVDLQTHELQAMLEAPGADFDRDELIRLLKTGHTNELNDWLQSLLKAHGLRGFVHKVMAPATHAVGEAWVEGNLAIHEEHLYTEVIKRLARRNLADQRQVEAEPRVMLTTVPGEQHSLGLLMVEILLRLGGAEVIPFGTEMPFDDIRQAAKTQRVHVIGLSFSRSFKTEDALVMLRGLRQIISPEVDIWVGGGAFDDVTHMPEGVDLLADLQSVETALVGWKHSVTDRERVEKC